MHHIPSLFLASAALWLAACSGTVTSGSPGATGGSAGADAGSDSSSGGAGASGGMAGAGGSDAGVPQPAAPVTLRFRNDSQLTVYVEWTWDSNPIPKLFFSGQTEPLSLTGECTDACGPTCACVMCDMAPPRAKIMEPGAVVEVVWDGTYYTFGQCANEGCECHEQQRAGVGHYHVALAGAVEVSGGTPDPTDPTVLQDAWINTSAARCQAEGDFTLSPSSGVFEYDIACAVF